MTFQDFNFDDKLFNGLQAMGYNQPTAIQQQAIPIIISGKDIIACAQTGTGKTAAFVLPLIDKILKIDEDKRHLTTLIISPTRELATQIDQQVEGLGYFTGVSSISIYGGGDGSAWTQQKNALELGTDIIIATPGRLIALLQMGQINFEHLKHLVLDEADRMLDMGFYDDILKIIGHLPKERQTILFSATMPPKIKTLAKTILNNPSEVSIAVSKPSEGIDQRAYMTFDTQKNKLLLSILKETDYKSVIIFASTKEKVKKLNTDLQRAKVNIKAFHSDLEQKEREEILREFKNKSLPILVGTDILSRGIDVEGIELVINYDVPNDPEDYIHRIGRTARAATTGIAMTFINDKDQQKFSSIETMIGREITKSPIPEELGEAPIYQPEVRPKSNHFSGKKPFNKKFKKKTTSTVVK